MALGRIAIIKPSIIRHSGELQGALVFAARKGVGKILVHVRTAALDPLVFPGTACFCVRVLLEFRALLPSQLNLAIRIVISAGPGTLPALVRHVFVVARAVLGDRRFCGIVGDQDAAHSSVDQLVSFFRLLHVPLVVHAGHGACILDGLARICHSTAKNAQGCGHGYEKLLEVHRVLVGKKPYRGSRRV